MQGRSGGLLVGSSILVTGGTGSFGRAFVRYCLDHCEPRRVVVFSRDELKQSEMREQFANDPRLRWFLGDVRDRDRIHRSLHNVDYVVHAAALKQVDSAEYNPIEYVKTNVTGSQNVIEASIDAGVKRVIALSTDKASSPVNLYGATKLTSDKLFIAANNYGKSYGTSFAVVRYGNVMGSRGSVIPLFRKLAAEGKAIPITDKRMTRFWIRLDEAVKFVIDSFEMMTGGELYVPAIPSMRITELAEAITPEAPIEEIGIRPGEKLHEEMISADDSMRALKLPGRFVILPVMNDWGFVPPDGEPLPEGFSYRSDTNSQWLSVEDLRAMLKDV